MEILVFSDSHGNTSNMITVIQRYPKIEYIIHLGDCGTDIVDIGQVYPIYIIDGVHGNCDIKKMFPVEKVLQLVGKRILITHGHNYGVKYSMTSILAKGLQEKVDIILFGHTHEPLIDMMGGILLVNPGSITKPKNCLKSTFAILELTKTNIKAQIHSI